MHTGAITNYIDVAQLALYAFWVFFAALIYYLRSEDKREGYPLESDRRTRGIIQGFPPIPRAKVFHLQHGGIRVVPDRSRDIQARAERPFAASDGTPVLVSAAPMLDALGPGAYALRPDETDKTIEGTDRIVPLRVADDFHLDPRDPDPRGMAVRGADGAIAGQVIDVWVDRSETLLRYVEVQTEAKVVLLPINFARISKRRGVLVKSITAGQFADVPATKDPHSVTLLEEERIMAYYSSGHLYAMPQRLGPWL